MQDLVVVLLTVTLLGLALMFLWRVWQEIVGAGNLQQAISDIIYVFITVELYRLTVHYLRYHRVAEACLESWATSLVEYRGEIDLFFRAYADYDLRAREPRVRNEPHRTAEAIPDYVMWDFGSTRM